jgi:hypothetical protein
MTWSCSPLPCWLTLHALQVPMSASETWTLSARRRSASYHPPTGSFDSSADVDSITESMGGLCLHVNEARASKGTQPHDFTYPRLKRQLDTILGPRSSQQDLHCLYFVFANALA